jgi:hypothetical protein
MGQLDMTLDGLLLPNMATFSPAFGTKKSEEKKGLTTLEATLNMMMPFSRMRPFVASENSTTTEIQADSVIVAAGDTAAITIADGAYIGCKLSILNTTSHVVDVLAGISVFVFDAGEILPLIYMPGGWMRTNHLPPGIVVYCAHNDYALAMERILPLTGAVLPIADYPGLCRRVYVGDTLNATAPSFFKTSDESGTVRDINGQFLTAPNCRGIFIRGAGSQTRSVTWKDSDGTSHTKNTPYDGQNMGSFGHDTTRTISGSVRVTDTKSNGNMVYYADGAFTYYSDGSSHRFQGDNSGGKNGWIIQFNSGRVVPVGGETAPAWLSLVVGISY